MVCNLYDTMIIFAKLHSMLTLWQKSHSSADCPQERAAVELLREGGGAGYGLFDMFCSKCTKVKLQLFETLNVTAKASQNFIDLYVL